MTASFELQITRQHWLGEPDDQSHDACSHGGIRAVISGTVVTSDETEYGVSQSALALLRTLERDHSPGDRVNDGYLLCHGCGYPIVFGCGNFGTDWVVHHEGEEVVLSQPRHIDSVTSKDFDIQVRVRKADYRRQVVSFAQAARAFYLSVGPRSVQDWEQHMHDQFWAEFDERLNRANAAAVNET